MRGCYPERGMDHGLFVWLTFDATEKTLNFSCSRVVDWLPIPGSAEVRNWKGGRARMKKCIIDRNGLENSRVHHSRASTDTCL